MHFSGSLLAKLLFYCVFLSLMKDTTHASEDIDLGNRANIFPPHFSVDDVIHLKRKLMRTQRTLPTANVKQEEERSPDFGSLNRVMRSCLRALKFFRSHVTQMNLDAVIGTRIAEAQFKLVLKALEGRAGEQENVPKDSGDDLRWMAVIGDLRLLHSEAEDLNALAEPFIRATFPEYYEQLGTLLQSGFWEVPLSEKLFNASAQPLTDTNNVLNGVEQLVESQSDDCVTEASGIGGNCEEEDGLRCHHCSVGQKCWDLMTKPGYSGYSLTHQVFYLLIGIQAGCGQQEEMYAHSTIRNEKKMTLLSLLEEMCYSIFIEATTIAQADFPEMRQDLFMEQGAICGLLGYRDFFRKHWLDKVLSWQRANGCFGDFQLYIANQGSLSAEDTSSHPLHSRIKREERAMAGHCLAHRTTVALGYLSLYVRYLTLALLK